MDVPFDPATWKPTQVPRNPDNANANDLPPDRLDELIASLSTETKKILRYPYDPRHWFARAIVLNRLRYPELAVGDAVKAGLLCDNLLDRLNQEDGRGLGYKCGFWMLDEVEEAGGDKLKEALVLCITSLRDFARRVEKCSLRSSQPDYDEGTFIPREYPWMEDRHRGRSDELIAQFNQAFATRAPRSTRAEGPFCKLRRHAFGEDHTGCTDTSDILGVFALRDIPEHTLILIDRTQHFGCNGPGKTRSESDWSYETSCPDALHPNHPSDSTDHDLQWIRDRAGTRAADILLTCRFLLGCAVQPDINHPLDSPTIASLTLKYHIHKPSTFLRQDDYILPNQYLQQIGIDIFANLAYDTWVFFTLQARIENNSCESSIHACVHPLFSFFNHSCAPNVAWSMQGRDKANNSMLIRAQRDIERGEQLFVEYNSYVHDLALEKRRERLRKWFDAECMCVRCVAEEAEISAIQGRVERGEIVVPVRQEWDLEVRPVFPEDSLLGALRALQVTS